MRFVKASGMLGLVALAVIASPSAMAQDSGWYAGLNVGQSKAKIDDAKITSSLLGAGFTGVSISDSNTHLGYKIFAGYEFNRYFALEGGYFDLGKFGFSATTVPAGSLTGSARFKGLNFDAVLSLPLTEKFSVFGRAGLAYAEAKDSFSGTGGVNVLNPNPSKRAANFKYGAGVQYDFTKSFGMRAEAERYRVNDAINNKGDIDLLSLGVLLRFGRHQEEVAPQPMAPPPPPPPAPEPAPAPPPPPPPPAPAPAPVIIVMPAPTPQKFVLDDARLHFITNKADLDHNGRAAVKEVANKLKVYTGDFKIVVMGFTDSRGGLAFNHKLSKLRAESVAKELVHDGVDAGRIITVGQGPDKPVADNATPQGRAHNRRVEVEVVTSDPNVKTKGVDTKPPVDSKS